MNCQVCGKEKKIKPAYLKIGGGKYCSKKCADIGRKKREIIKCQVCEKTFEAQTCTKRKVCSQKCQAILASIRNLTGVNKLCQVCGKEFYVQQWQIKKGVGRFCSPKCRVAYLSIIFSGQNSPAWKGEDHSYIDTDGYVQVRSPNHPKAINKYIKRAILVAEKKLGRPLKLGEITHHINQIRDDDRLENIIIMTRAEHNRIHHAKSRI